MTSPTTMTAVAVRPGERDSLHLTELPVPTAGPGEALVRVRQVGVCGTDQEIIHGQFGTAPAGAAELVLGHEVLGVVEALGPGTADARVAVGDTVVATVRRPGGCVPCQAGQSDMCDDLVYTEHGIIGRHGFMAEWFATEATGLVKVPPALAAVGILTEPTSVAEKALQQAELIQRRIPTWTPRTAIVLGAGPIGLLTTLLLRSRGIAVVTAARKPAPNRAAGIVETAGARYVSLRQTTLAEVAAGLPPVDLIVEATGNADLAFQAMEALGNNGVLVLLSLTGDEQRREVPISRVNREFVLGNKVLVGCVNSNKEHFEMAVADLARFEALWPGLLSRLVTRRLHGLADPARIAEREADGIKTVIEVG